MYLKECVFNIYHDFMSRKYLKQLLKLLEYSYPNNELNPKKRKIKPT